MCGNKSTYQKTVICNNCGTKTTFTIPKGTTWRDYCNNSVRCWNQDRCPYCGCNDFSDYLEKMDNKPFLRYDPIDLITTYL